MILQWGIERADKAGVEAYLEGTEVGKPLYEKFGFRTVRELNMDLSKWGVDAIHTTYVMIRPAKSQAQARAVAGESDER